MLGFTLKDEVDEGSEGLQQNCPPLPTPVISLRCCGFRPSGPPAEPLGKESMALAISSSVTEMVWSDSSGDGGMMEQGRGAGCFYCRAVRVVSLILAMETSKHAVPSACRLICVNLQAV